MTVFHTMTALMVIPGTPQAEIDRARQSIARRMLPTKINDCPENPAFTTSNAFRRIVGEVLAAHNIDRASIFSKSRARHVLDARQEAWARLYAETKLSLPQIGAKCGGYHHTTVLYVIRKKGVVTGKMVKPMTAQAKFAV